MTLATLEDTRERAALAPYAEAVHDAIGASMAPNTRRAYRTQWAAFTTWADGRGVQSLPAAPETLAAYLAARAEADGLKLATLKGMAAAVGAAHKAARLDNPADSEGVRRTLKGLGRKVGAPQRQAPGLTADAMAAVRATARLPRRGRGGILESAEAAAARAAVDVALLSTMRDGLLRRSEAAAVTWADVDAWADGSGRLTIRRSKTDADGKGAVVFLGRPTMKALEAIRDADADASAPVFGLSESQVNRRIKAAAAAAGLGPDFSGHSARVGMAQDLTVHGVDLPALQVAGRWKAPAMPARYAERAALGRGAVARYYGAA
jgi:integrase